MVKQVQGIEVIGEASCGEDLIGLVHSFHPKVLVVDFLSEGFNIDDIRRVKSLSPKLRILAITSEQSGHTLVNALRAGVDSYIKKDCDLGEVEDAIRETSRGGTFFCGKILERIREESIDVDDLESLPLSCDPIHLSARETEVLQLIAEGLTNIQVAEKLFLSAHTVTTHRKNMTKLRREQHSCHGHVCCENWIGEPEQVSFSTRFVWSRETTLVGKPVICIKVPNLRLLHHLNERLC